MRLRRGVLLAIAIAAGPLPCRAAEAPVDFARDIQPLLARLALAGVVLYRPLRESWYPVGNMSSGQREFLVQDPDGYLLRFVQHLGERPVS